MDKLRKHKKKEERKSERRKEDKVVEKKVSYDSNQDEQDCEIRVREITADADGLRAPVAIAEGADVVPPYADSVPVIGIVGDESGTRSEGPHPDINALEP